MSSSISNGGVSLLLKIVASPATTSIAPVGSFGLRFSPRSRTVPRTPTTHSERAASAISKTCVLTDGSNTTCTRPVTSRRSRKMQPPWSRRFWTQPNSTTSLPTSPSRSSPQRCVRLSSSMNRATWRLLQPGLAPKSPLIDRWPTKSKRGTMRTVVDRASALR
jgi:hypothetical protein